MTRSECADPGRDDRGPDPIGCWATRRTPHAATVPTYVAAASRPPSRPRPTKPPTARPVVPPADDHPPSTPSSTATGTPSSAASTPSNTNVPSPPATTSSPLHRHHQRRQHRQVAQNDF